MGRKLANSELGRLTVEEYRQSEKRNFVVVMDNVRSQHNVGAAFRTADAFRAGMVVLCGISAVPPSPEIHKSALGAEFSVDWKYFKKTEDAVMWLKEEGYIIVSVEQAEDSVMLDAFEPLSDKKYAFVFGNEVKGVLQEVVEMSDIVLEIPQYGTKHSLNVSVSVGVVIWDMVLKGNRKL